MQHILLISNTQSRSLLEKAIDRENFSIIATLKNSANLAADLQKYMTNQVIDMLVMDLEKSGETVLEAIRQLMEHIPLPVVMFVRQGDRQSAAEATKAGASAYVVNGLIEDRVGPILAAAITRFQETQLLREELMQTKISLQERKIIERAKGLLMEQRGCNENEAYTTLRKLAMEHSKRMSEVAQSIIDCITLIAG